jgi:hypothetical protein
VYKPQNDLGRVVHCVYKPQNRLDKVVHQVYRFQNEKIIESHK